MLATAELWDDARTQTPCEILGSILRTEFEKESVRRADLSYLSLPIHRWWKEQQDAAADLDLATQCASLKALILAHLQPEHLKWIQVMGSSEFRIAAILFDHVFSIPDKVLARLVHEAFTEISGIIDIKYPYEEHKELFPKNSDVLASDWGRGLGIIRPHVDDLYEHRDINAMCLTVCKDTSSTPTWFWLLKDVVACISDEELGTFALSDAMFCSGTNVEGQSIVAKKPVLRMDDVEGLSLRIDFRVDDSVGPRMRFEDPKVQAIFDKLREGLKRIKPLASTPSTGSVGLLANFKILHGRASLNPVMLYEGESSRILFRSKGIR